MKRKADQFENVLQSSAQGERAESWLAPLVQTAHRVESLSETPPPPPHGLMPGRQRFLAEAARLRREQVRRQPRPALALRLVTALAAIALVFGAVLGVGRTAAASLPGQPLYGAKLAVERIRAALTFQPASRSALTQALAEERLGEILALLEERQEVSTSVSNRAMQQLREALAAAARLEDSAAPLALQKLAEAIRLRERAMLEATGESPEPPVQELLRDMERVRQEAHLGEGDPNGLRQRLRHGTPAEPTGQPGATPTPDPLRAPGQPPTATPHQTGRPSSSPEPSGTSHHTPAVSATPQPTGSPPATRAPGPSATPQSTGSPHATHTPGPSATAQPSEPPRASETPGQGGPPDSTARPEVTPAQTPGSEGGGGQNKP
jgi:hypothetical protein